MKNIETQEAEQALTTIPEYNKTAQGLIELKQRLAGLVYDVSTGKGMEAAKKDRALARSLRIELEAERVRIKAPALQRAREIDTEAKRITAEIEALEDPIDAQIKAEEQRKEREKAEREQAERDRVAALHARFEEIKGRPLLAVGKDAETIQGLIVEAEAVDPSTFPDDMTAAAKFTKDIAIAQLKAALDERRAYDAEQVRLLAERAELDKLRREADERRAEDERRAQAERERLAAERAEAERVAREKEQARQAEQRAELARQEAELDKRRQAEKAEAERIAREQAQAREKLAAEQAELARQRLADEIAKASLLEAASDALTLLQAEYPTHKATKKLAAAIARETKKAAA